MLTGTVAGPHHCLRAPRPGPVGQAVRLSETAIAFARLCLCGVETVLALTGENRAFLVCFSVAVATSVSTVAVQGRAVVMAVSYWPVSAVAVVLVVSMSPWCRASRAKKFALRAQNTPNSAFLRSLGEFFTEMPVEGRCWASFFAPTGVVPRTCRRCGALQACCAGGFAALEAGWRSISGVSQL